ncbi:hypothetical protein OIE68_21610 [Nocardia vinacea]|uniref:Uncharacterized protein n=1 Tax=Nocardia vinacea TaxID=96468 RepID=A0ABZ1YXV1_9NOCA|nr:hypothetical protein OIE68_21610 [Nocardia vinacea]
MSTGGPGAGDNADQHGADPASGARGADAAGSRSGAPESGPGTSAPDHAAGPPPAGAEQAPPESGPGTGESSAAPGDAGFESEPPQPVPPGTEPRRFGTPPRAGSVQRQEPGVTQPRPPTVAEARARDKARKRAEDAQRAATAAAEHKKRTRKRVLIGGVAIVGVAGLVGGGYLAYRALTKPDQVTAYCTVIDQNGQEVVAADDQCQTASTAVGSGTTGAYTGSNGIFIYNGTQYRYYYGGNNTVGKPPTGGTTVQPKGAQISTKSGSTVTRGGLGTSSKSSGGS